MCRRAVQRPKRFCNRACWSKWKRNRLPNGAPVQVASHDRDCKLCGRAFRPKPAAVRRGNGRYCSRRCANAQHRRPDAGKSRMAWYNSRGWQKFSVDLRARTGRCDRCDSTSNLEVHHLQDPYPRKSISLLFEAGNLLVLCRQCHRATHATVPGFRCRTCGAASTGYRGKRYCSMRCYNSARKRRRARCPICGTGFVAPNPRSTYCSRECACAATARAKIARRVKLKCESCNVTFSVPPSNAKRYRRCSRTCGR